MDRDGVINKFPGRGKYVTNLREFRLISSSISAIKRLTQNGFLIFVISNQAGVAKKLYSMKTLNAMTAKMLKKIQLSGGKISKVIYCLHRYDENCSCRKPKTVMIRQALKTINFKIDRKNSYLIGDDIGRDILMGKNARLKTILVLSGREKIQERASWRVKPDYIFKNLSQAARFIININA